MHQHRASKFMPPFPSTNGSYNGASHPQYPSVPNQLNGKAYHIVTNMVPHMGLHPLASIPQLRTVVPSEINRAHYVVVHPPINILTNMTPIADNC